MANPVDNISINDIFWLMIKEYILCFRFKSMPKDIHFTIAFNKDSSDINLHVTKNTNTGQNKPAIEIMRIDKKELQELMPYITGTALSFMLQPIHFNTSRRRVKHSHYGIHFYPFNASPQSGTLSIETMLINELKPMARLKKSRLKIDGDFESQIKKLTTSRNFIQTFEKGFQWLPRKLHSSSRMGFILSKQFTGCALYINNKWFGVRQNINPVDLLNGLMAPELVKHLVFKTLMAYARIKSTPSHHHSEYSNDPIRLFKLIP